MPISKQSILDDVQLYTAQELYQHIMDGVVTFEELVNESEGHFLPKVRKQLEKMLEGGEEEEWYNVQKRDNESGYKGFIALHPKSFHCAEARDRIKALQALGAQDQADREWEGLDKGSLDALQGFNKRYPKSPHTREANDLIWDIFNPYGPDRLVGEIRQIETDPLVLEKSAPIVELIKKRIQEKKISSGDLLALLKDDHNIFSSAVVFELCSSAFLHFQDLLDIGIKRPFIQRLLEHESSEQLPFTGPIVKINKVSTEIYFWGIPSSGKTCALGGILHVANDGHTARTMIRDTECQGYGYMTSLPEMFHSNGVCRLPPGTPVYATYEMGFDLIDNKKATHPITLIDLAGELVRCMYKFMAKLPLSDQEELALDTLTRILIDNRSVNRKVHFFVVEYGGENRLYDGKNQSVYLDAALRYIEQTKIFEKDTDAIYLIITKVDIIGQHGAELQETLRKYIESSDYKAFYNGLEYICERHQINGGVVEVIPFSLGEVCFQDFCIFNENASSKVVKKILERSKGFKSDKFNKFIKQ